MKTKSPNCTKDKRTTYSTARAVPKAILTLVFHVSGLLKSSDK